jgi:hypothetical protein
MLLREGKSLHIGEDFVVIVFNVSGVQIRMTLPPICWILRGHKHTCPAVATSPDRRDGKNTEPRKRKQLEHARLVQRQIAVPKVNGSQQMGDSVHPVWKRCTSLDTHRAHRQRVPPRSPFQDQNIKPSQR